MWVSGIKPRSSCLQHSLLTAVSVSRDSQTVIGRDGVKKARLAMPHPVVEVAEDGGLAKTQLWTRADAAKKGLWCVQNPRSNAVKCRLLEILLYTT